MNSIQSSDCSYSNTKQIDWKKSPLNLAKLSSLLKHCNSPIFGDETEEFPYSNGTLM